MSEKPRAFYVALAVSAVSTFAWIGAVLGAFVFLYTLITGGPSTVIAALVIVGIIVGAGSALLERRIYRVDSEG